MQWFKELELEKEDRNKIKLELVDDSRDKMKKIAKGILKLRFWVAEDRSSNYSRNGGSYLMTYPNPYYHGNNNNNNNQRQNPVEQL